MTNLGPTPASSLQPLRPGDRDPRERQHHHGAPRKPATQDSPQSDSAMESVAEFDKEGEAHQLDERA